MSYTSVTAAVKALVASQLPGAFVTVADVDELEPGLDPGMCPALIITPVPGRRTPLASQPGGWTIREWDVECHILAYYGALVGTGDGFRGLVEQVEGIFGGSNYTLGGAGDVGATDFVLAAGLQQATKFVPWEPQNGYILRHAYVSAHIRESIHNG